ncbi:MAG: 50S ribosomal protein L23 [Syntrophobacterales bacterium]|nr:50S ribosomal protein L23 [Syntrophobacterales bacterium]
MDLYSVIKRPLVTEKTTIARDEENKYVFIVNRKATKIDIRNAVEKIFKVKVMGVRTINVTGKKKRLGRTVGKGKDWKKVIISLPLGSSVDIFE